MTTPGAATPALEPTPLADYVAGVLRSVRSMPPEDLDLADAYGRVLAEDACALTPLPAYDHAGTDGYAARWQDLVDAAPHRPVRLDVLGDLGPSSSRPARVDAGVCFSVAAGAPLPAAADVVISPAATDQGAATVEVGRRPRRSQGVRRAGEEIRRGQILARAGKRLSPGLVAVLAATGIGRVRVRPRPRVAIIAIGDELVPAGRVSRPGQVVDANSHALAAAAIEADALPHRVGICPDDPVALQGALDDQLGRVDLIVTTGGTGTGPRDLLRRVLRSVRFTEMSLFPCRVVGYGTRHSGPVRGEEVPVICLPGDPGAAMVGFEALVRPVIGQLAGGEPFRRSVRAHLLDTVTSPAGLREFRPARVSERRGGGYTARPLPGGPYSLSGIGAGNGLIVFGEKVTTCPAGSMVDVLLLDRR